MVIKINYTSSDVYVSTNVSPVYVVVNYSGTSGGGGNFVPYTGATTNVDLGEYELKAGQLTLDVSPTGTASVGTTRWNNTIGSSETTLKGGSVILKNGVDLVARVVNKVSPNTNLTKAAYQAVRVSGAQGQRLAVAFAQANNDAGSADTIGLVIETINTNQEGFIMTVGNLEGINTTGSLQGETWADGDVLYLSPTTPGALTNIKPTGATGHIVIIGYVEYAHVNNGKIYVKVMNGWELDELHNVYISSVANNDALIYESSTSLWKNKTIATALGYTPVPTTRTLTINGTAYDLSADRSWTVAAGLTGSGTTNYVPKFTGATTIGNSLIYDDGTKVGIGTTAPQSITILDLVKTTNNYTYLRIANLNGGNQAESGVRLQTNSGYLDIVNFPTGATSQSRIMNTSANGIRFWNLTPSATANFTWTFTEAETERMRLTAAGRLLLGTTTESTYLLDVNGTARVSGGLVVNETDATTYGLKTRGLYLQGFNDTNSVIGFNTFIDAVNFKAKVTGFYQYINVDGANVRLWGSNASVTAGSTGTMLRYFDFNPTESKLFDSKLNSDNSTYVEFITGTGSNLNDRFLKFSFTTGGGYSHYIVPRHNNSAGSVQNQISLYLNNSTTAGGSSAPTTGNVLNNTQSAISSAFFQPTLFKTGGAVTDVPVASAAVEVISTTKGFLPPRMTTTQKNAIGTPAAGLMVFDTTLAKLCVYSGTAWETITSI